MYIDVFLKQLRFVQGRVLGMDKEVDVVILNLVRDLEFKLATTQRRQEKEKANGIQSHERRSQEITEVPSGDASWISG